MNTKELRERLGLPDNLDSKRLRSRALRECCAGGEQLLDAKEWASGVATRSQSEAARHIGRLALEKIEAVEEALIRALERAKDIPPGSIR